MAAQSSSSPSVSTDALPIQEQQLQLPQGQFIPALVQPSIDTIDLPSDTSSFPLPIQKRADPISTTTATPTISTTAATSTKSKPSKTASTQSGMATISGTPTAAVQPTMTPDSKGDTALFGKPSVIGAFNLTTGILIYSAFMILFLSAIGFATYQRAQYRNQFRLQQKLNMEGGRTTPGAGGSKRGGGEDLSDAALFKQASISKRALMKDVGPGGVLAANEAMKTKIASANGAGRSYDEREMANGLGQQSSGMGVRFGESTGATQGSTGRTGGMKKTTQAYEMNSYGHTEDAMSYYQDNHDTTDYSRPPLTESADPYYSSGSSNSGYLDQVEDYHYNPAGGSSPQMPKPSYQQTSNSNVASPQPGQSPLFVQRTNSSRMPKGDLHDGNNLFRSNSGRRAGASTPTRGLERNGSGGQPSRIVTQGHLDRSGSGGNGYTGTTSPISPHADGNAMSRSGSNASSGRTKVSPSPVQMHPTPIARSNSTRLPPSMRGGAPQPSNLSQANNYDYM
ncbi:hypothetical protein KI688_005186 [Linnemannia hyalina]|uniref:Uncharacterized protein n=1 Tax=Linnemannia hyalina TaxID=64524 RepID=A0A9P7XMZ9_9FUNG|nr:hypothetical protein KI688_005186 [Linnemannia hyalina]